MQQNKEEKLIWTEYRLGHFWTNMFVEPHTIHNPNYNLHRIITWPVTAVVIGIKARIVYIAVVLSTEQFPCTVLVDVTIPCSLFARIVGGAARVAAVAGCTKALICACMWIIYQICMETRRGAEVVRQKSVPFPQKASNRVIFDRIYLHVRRFWHLS